MQTTRRLTTGAVLIAVLALFAGACSSSDSEGATTTTEKEKKEETTTTDAEGTDADTTSDTVSDEDFDAAIGELTDQIDAADGDACGLLDVFTQMSTVDLPNPSTAAQVKTATGLLDQLFTAIADSAPAENAAEAETIRSTVESFDAAVEENDYDPEWFNSDDNDPFSDEEFSAALETFYTTATAACAPDTATTVAP